MEFKYKNLTGEVITANVERRIPYSLACAIIQNVVEAVIDEAGNYTPFIGEIALAQHIIQSYTDVEIESVDELERYWNTKESDLKEEIFLHIDLEQIEWMQKAINDSIAYEKQKDGVMRFASAIGQTLVKIVDDKTVQKVLKKIATVNIDGEALNAFLKKAGAVAP